MITARTQRESSGHRASFNRKLFCDCYDPVLRASANSTRRTCPTPHGCFQTSIAPTETPNCCSGRNHVDRRDEWIRRTGSQRCTLVFHDVFAPSSVDAWKQCVVFQSAALQRLDRLWRRRAAPHDTLRFDTQEPANSTQWCAHSV